MIFTTCVCNEPIVVPWESGNGAGYYRTDCPCGRIAMTECTSLGGETHIFDTKKELDDFVVEKKLNVPTKEKCCEECFVVVASDLAHLPEFSCDKKCKCHHE